MGHLFTVGHPTHALDECIELPGAHGMGRVAHIDGLTSMCTPVEEPA